MAHNDMTIADVLKDPLIRQMMRADRIKLSAMKNLLEDAAQRQRNTKQSRHSLTAPHGIHAAL